MHWSVQSLSADSAEPEADGELLTLQITQLLYES